MWYAIKSTFNDKYCGMPYTITDMVGGVDRVADYMTHRAIECAGNDGDTVMTSFRVMGHEDVSFPGRPNMPVVFADYYLVVRNGRVLEASEDMDGFINWLRTQEKDFR